MFDGEKPEKAKTHYKRFNQYIKFQTKKGNIKDTTKEAIELFEHTLDKKALIWFQQHKADFKDLTTMKNMFLARYNPWGKMKRKLLQLWNNLSFDPQKMDIDEQIDLVLTLGNMLQQDEHSKMEKFIEICAFCGGFNHSPKHCFKGEHDINNLMEKMSLGSSNQHQNFYINNGEHDNPHELPKENIEGSLDTVYNDYTHTDIPPKVPEEIEKLEYIYLYQCFQDHEKVYETDPQVTTEQTDDTLYPQINNDIEYGLFDNVIYSYYLDSQIRDDFQCTKACYRHDTTASTVDTNPQCTHTYDYISQQQQMLYTNEADASLFTTDTSTQCALNIIPSNLETESVEDINEIPQNNTGIHFYSKHKYRDTFGDAHIQYHDFDNGDAFIDKDNTQHYYNKNYKTPIGV